MAHYSVLEVTPSNEAWIPDYLPTATRIMARHGGKYLARTNSHEQLEGATRNAALRIVIEWPLEQAAKDFMADPDYRPHLDNRHAGSTSLHWLIAGQYDLA